MPKPRPSKKTNQQQKLVEKLRSSFPLKDVQPLTDNQAKAFRYFYKRHLCLHGTAGTGKTFISIYLALNEVLNKRTYEKLVIIKSTVPSRDIGFLPGSIEEKTEIYEAPYRGILEKLTGVHNAYEQLKLQNLIEFMPTSFARGNTIDDSIIIVDEIQNQTYQELDTVFTRIGKNCKIIFAGDMKQNDLQQHKEKSGCNDFLKVLKSMIEFGFVEFGPDDITRSDLVKSYIIIRDRLESEGVIKGNQNKH